MLHQKLIAGEQPGTYWVTDLATDDLLTIAQAVARQKLAKGVALTDKHLAHQALQGLLQTRDREVFAARFWITSTGYWPMKSCFSAPCLLQPSTPAMWSNGHCTTMPPH